MVTGMCGNRVEELESRVQELEASVRGLTDELVECKVRLRDLEDAEAEDDLLTTDDSRGDAAGESGEQPAADPGRGDRTVDGSTPETEESDPQTVASGEGTEPPAAETAGDRTPADTTRDSNTTAATPDDADATTTPGEADPTTTPGEADPTTTPDEADAAVRSSGADDTASSEAAGDAPDLSDGAEVINADGTRGETHTTSDTESDDDGDTDDIIVA